MMSICYVVFWIIGFPQVYEIFGVSFDKQYSKFLVFIILFFLVLGSGVFTMASFGGMRFQELQADRYSYNLYPNNHLSNALEKLHLSYPKDIARFYHPLYDLLFITHPALMQRLEQLSSLKQRSRKQRSD